MPTQKYQQFIQLVREIHTAASIAGLLEWDQETYMPPRGSTHRADQVALIASLRHERLTSDRFAALLADVEAEGPQDDPAIDTNIREMRRAYDRAAKLPNKLVTEIARVTTLSRDAWVKAREDADFPRFAPHLERVLELKREVAQRLDPQGDPYDALMDEFEPGAKAADIEAVFAGLKEGLVPLVDALKDAPRQPDTDLLSRSAPIQSQSAFNRRIAAEMGFDFRSGRIDVSVHPFCMGMTPLDVRLTTRYDEFYLPGSLFGSMHEAGHGLYEQGFDPDHTATPMAQSVSLGIHESQSRLWENAVGRSRPFWQHYFPVLQESFPAFADVDLDDWYFAINTVRPSYIRVEADEVTYGLHIMLRFDVERRLLKGEIAVTDVPNAWNQAMQDLLGIMPPDDAQGCLQDVHWSLGILGYFPTYQLGNMYAAQFFTAARQALPDLETRIAAGDLIPLREWLRENIHTHGMRFRAHELVQRVCNQPLSHEPFLDYLRNKYEPLYGI